MLSLYIRNAVFFVLQPGIVVGLLPYLIIGQDFFEALKRPLHAVTYLGILLIILGLSLVLYCIYHFIVYGRGTFSPIDRTQQLVVSGPYRFTRNPMYVGIIITLLGEVVILKSWQLLIYTLLVFVAFHLFVMYIEEPRLKEEFGKEFKTYASQIRRWI